MCFYYGADKRIRFPVAREGMRPSSEKPAWLADYPQEFEAEYFVAAGDELQPLANALTHWAILGWQPVIDYFLQDYLAGLPNYALIDPMIRESEALALGGLEGLDDPREDGVMQERFRNWMSRLPRKDKAYLLCTGPSLSRFAEFDFSDGHVIGCNTSVSNQALMSHARPCLMVAADPVFNFGPSVYSDHFRRDLMRGAESQPFFFLTLRAYERLAARHLPLGPDRIAHIRPGADAIPRRLDDRWIAPSTGNIMTLLMLPAAFTISRSIHIIGADGREPGEDYFWKHDPTSQLSGEMDTVRAAHPAFFARRDYRAYYDEHCRVVDEQIRVIEAAGGEVRSLTPSHIPALREREI